MAMEVIGALLAGSVLLGVILIVLLFVAALQPPKKKNNIGVRKNVKADLNKIKDQINGDD